MTHLPNKSPPAQQERILVIAHAHPDFSLGGGEIAAHNLYRAYKQDPNVISSWFLGRGDRGRGVSGLISLRRPDEYIWEQSSASLHSMKAAHIDSVTTWFADLCSLLRPTIVHTHHYLHLGLEYLRIIKQILPSTRIYLTLHEYLAICENNGQMIKTGAYRLCNRESPDDCRMCFPEWKSIDFWLRKHFYQKHFELIDGFVAPSRFLRQRYIDWGLNPERIAVIENGQTEMPPLAPRPLQTGETRNRFGFFGQINPYKGLHVLLTALNQMPKRERSKLVVEVHGANLEVQPVAFRDQIDSLREPLVKSGVVEWVGPYQPHELRSRMERVDWVVVPSIWWENSPMVIQEAFSCGRPVICSDIGGMREKVRDNIDGLHVSAGLPSEWSRVLRTAAQFDAEWDRLQSAIVKPINYRACARIHLETFHQWGVAPKQYLSEKSSGGDAVHAPL